MGSFLYKHLVNIWFVYVADFIFVQFFFVTYVKKMLFISLSQSR